MPDIANHDLRLGMQHVSQAIAAIATGYTSGLDR